MKKLLFLLVALMATLCIQAQKVMIFENGKLIKTYQNTPTQTVKVVVEEEPLDEFLTAGSFSVSDTKKVRFTKGNLYWNGKAFKLEANQTDYPTGVLDEKGNYVPEANHIGHFYWTKEAANSFTNKSYDDGTNTVEDVPFFAESKGGIIAEGVSGLFALSQGEWNYLITSRTNAANLCKSGVSVTNNGSTYSNCLIIAPDGFESTLKSSYTLEEVNCLGLVCLPDAKFYTTGLIYTGSTLCYYWTSTTKDSSTLTSHIILFDSTTIRVDLDSPRSDGLPLRLVRLAQ